jgi:hypothetical protein
VIRKLFSLTAMGLLIILAGDHALAEEGMWPLYDLHKLPLDSLKAKGLRLEPNQIYNPQGGGISDAVVRVNATGSFVSPNGLIITNHHVAYGAVQKQSSVERNLITDGFYAATPSEEIPAIGYDVYVTLAIDDMTDRVLAVLDDSMTDLERYRAIDRVTKEIIKEAETGRDVRCRVASMFGGKQYMLYTYFRIRDIRIVYVPPASIGKYGGDIDNWMWPRHTGDFSFLRAYVAPDGSSAEYAEDNVPYQSETYLPISSAGVRDGDLAMIIGFPRHTNRYASSYYIDDLVNYYFPDRIRMYEDLLELIRQAGMKDSSIAIRLASMDAGINNSLKNNYAMLEGFTEAAIIQKKIDDEKLLAEFINVDAGLKKKYASVLPGLDSLYLERRKTRDKDFVLGSLGWADFFSLADEIYRWAVEREKNDMERRPGYQDRDSISTREWLENAQINLVPSFDKEVLRYFLMKAFDLPRGQRIEAIDKIFTGKKGAQREACLDRYLDDLYGNTAIGDLDRRMKMFGMSRRQLEEIGDPFIDLAVALMPECDEQTERARKFKGASTRLEPKLIAAYAEWRGEELYPDANGTMRFNYGFVKGYSPRDAIRYSYLTSLTGVMEKETGKDPFIVPVKLRQEYEEQNFGPYVDPVINDVPINFLTTNDGTGGNSGSPIINGKGELIGLDFDCNYESVASDYLFIPELARSIVVDIRYMLFVIDNVYHLDALLNELTIH